MQTPLASTTTQPWTAHLKWGPDALLPAIAQDIHSGRICMVAYVNEQALLASMERGYATFFSRSRGTLWTKGESSGHLLALRSIWSDCDSDAIVYLVEPHGPSCHTGADTCFFQARWRRAEAEATATPQAHQAELASRAFTAPLEPGKRGAAVTPSTQAIATGNTPAATPALSEAEARPSETPEGRAPDQDAPDQDAPEQGEFAEPVLASLERVIHARTRASARGSYTKSLLEGGIDKIAAKIREESEELIAALREESDANVAAECADLWYHVMVGLRWREQGLQPTLHVLDKRIGVSGHVEKASRSATNEAPPFTAES